ncbi:hypothetical protein ATO13_08636 [Stappia sp. 22II-S9-Z10]|nr:hypothetical protein ATO13_08636 [Stappia sp. 22II-S9-Z10]
MTQTAWLWCAVTALAGLHVLYAVRAWRTRQHLRRIADEHRRSVAASVRAVEERISRAKRSPEA